MNSLNGPKDNSPEAMRAFADDMAVKYKLGKTGLLEAGFAAFIAGDSDPNNMLDASLRYRFIDDETLINAARERALQKLEASKFVKRAQRPMLQGVIELLEAAPSLRRILTPGHPDYVRKDHDLPILNQFVSLLPEADTANYLLTLTSSKAFLTNERDMYNRPHLTLVEYDGDDKRDVTMYYSQGTHIHDDFEGIIIGSDQRRAPIDSRVVRPEKAPERLLADYQRFLDDARANIDTL